MTQNKTLIGSTMFRLKLVQIHCSVFVENFSSIGERSPIELPISRALKDLIGVVDCQNGEGNLLFKVARVNRGLHLLFMSNEITVI